MSHFILDPDSASFETVRVHMLKMLAAFKPAKPTEIVIRELKRGRTLAQNAKFHAIIGEVAKATGNHAEVIKNFVKDEMGAYNEVVFRGRELRVYDSSARWNTARMAEAIERAEVLAAECGVPPRDTWQDVG